MNKKTDTLVIVKLDNPSEARTRQGVIDKFKNNFLGKELSISKGKGNITKSDKFQFPGYFVSRMDLIQILFDISADITLDNAPFQDVLSKVLKDPKVSDSLNKNIGIGINFGQGFSDEIPKTENRPLIHESQELQLVIDAIGIVEKDKPSRMISCYTTANLHPIDPPITPPNGGTPYPDVRI